MNAAGVNLRYLHIPLLQTITDELTYDTLYSSEDNLWSVLLMTGYITKADAGEEGETVSLRIPNREVASIFEDTVVKLFKETNRYKYTETHDGGVLE